MELIGEEIVNKNKTAFEALVTYSKSFEDVTTLGVKELSIVKKT